MMSDRAVVCANFGECRKVLTSEAERVKIGRYTFCTACAEKRNESQKAVR